MGDIDDPLTALRDEFNRWEEVLGSMTEQELIIHQPDSGWSIKDVIAHLRAWQQISIARLEAAALDKQPEFPAWLEGLDPFEAESEENREKVNSRIHAEHRDDSWPSVHGAWRQGFLRLLELGEAIPEEFLTDPGRYTWLRGYPLAAVLQGSCEHHYEHRSSIVGSTTRGT
jgi:hypothetical protein